MHKLARFLAFLPATFPLIPLFPQGRNYGRSMVITQQGIAATSQTLASQAAAQILARGRIGGRRGHRGQRGAGRGRADDERHGRRPVRHLLGREDRQAHRAECIRARAAQALSPEFLAKQGIKAMPDAGIHTVTVPGAVDGWAKMHQRFGKLPWKDLFQSAIAYAEQGFPVTGSDPGSLGRRRLHDAASRSRKPRASFCRAASAPQVGDLFRNPDMARALRMIAEKGPRAFYKGEIAAAILKTSQRLGGTMTAEDLAAFSAEWVEPISIDYRGWRVYELPPNGQGMAALEMLNIMETIAARLRRALQRRPRCTSASRP